MLLLHGTGAATHSWRDVLPLLARHFRVVAPDLPGHGFTSQPRADRLSLPGMAKGVADLLAALDMAPGIAVGHSAGAAVAARMCLDGQIDPRLLISLNGALLPLYGPTGPIWSSLARTLVGLPFVPDLFAWRAGQESAVKRLLDSTGSVIDPQGAALYRRLVQDPGHVGAALGMMANWDLRPLERDLPRLRPHLLLVVGSNDRTVPPVDSRRVQAIVPGSELVAMPGLGHLSHEEKPVETAEIIQRAAATASPP